ncbi:thiolase family protein [Desulfopila sp. IMCC35008]|uniref:thiolase family protein n=1 Tax=Desulfopila sp. IMCC35008 TaxID=2653858 RepID=UPI0013D4874D|nr:thiolase family protein [Desulfopila sp. IMCC35008]
MKQAVIVAGVRTAVGKFGGGFKNTTAVDLGAAVIKEVFNRAGVRPEASAQVMTCTPDKLKDQGLTDLEKEFTSWDSTLPAVSIDEVIMGNVLTSGLGQNPGRQAMIRAGVPKETPAFTINKVCGSGLKSIALAAVSIMAGQADVIVAGGQENMTLAPMSLPQARWGYRMAVSGVGEINDLMVLDGLYEIFYGYHMGLTAENIAEKYGITRQEQDELSVSSQTRARKAIMEGLFAQEIVPVVTKTRKGEETIDTDEGPRETDMEKMSRLRSVFKKDGTVTAGNASSVNDGAAAVLVMSAEKAKEMGLNPILKIKAFASGGVDPAYMGTGPVPAIRKVLKQAGMSIGDIDAIELNEAFAAQAISCCRELGIDVDKPNQLGSGISLGHPIGCTGSRQMVTLMHQMQRKNYSTGLVTMCIGGGMGMAMIVER